MRPFTAEWQMTRTIKFGVLSSVMQTTLNQKANMKATTFKVVHSDGSEYKWVFEYMPRVYSTLGRHMKGWLLRTHDGCERFSEGNWFDFVPFVRLIASNYGCTTHIS